MPSFNTVTLIGHLVRDCELRHTPSGTAVLDNAVAVNERVKRGEDWVDEVNFVDFTIFGKRAETLSQYLAKGSPVLIDGRLKQETWESEGQKRSKLKVVAEDFVMLGSKGEQGESKPAPAKQTKKAASKTEKPASTEVGEDIPF